jgi:hypothetical protein
MSGFDDEPCDPPVGSITLGDDEPPAITACMHELFAADQGARQSSPPDWSRLTQEDAQRRHEILRYANHLRSIGDNRPVRISAGSGRPVWSVSG